MYKVSFYTLPGKISPIKGFLDSVSEKARTKIIRQLRYIEEFGLSQSIPNLKKLTNTPFWELRILGRDNIRVVCIALINREIKILHIFVKKKKKTPQKELKIAFSRYKELIGP